MKHLLSIRELSAHDLQTILALSEGTYTRSLQGRGVALYFEKPSARTRNSMEVAAAQLGGHPVYLQPGELGIGTRESVEDVTRTLACYHSIIAARVFDHALLEQMAGLDAAPVLNMLSATDHPLQALADLLTIKQLMGRIEGVRIAFIGEANNVARSLAEGCVLLGAQLNIASPVGFGFGRPMLAVNQLAWMYAGNMLQRLGLATRYQAQLITALAPIGSLVTGGLTLGRTQHVRFITGTATLDRANPTAVISLRDRIADAEWPGFSQRTDVPVSVTTLNGTPFFGSASVQHGVLVISVERDAGLMARALFEIRLAWMVDTGADGG